MQHLRSVAVLSTILVSSCAGASSARAPTSSVPPPRFAAEYDVHEWGVLRGGLDDAAQLSGPFGAETHFEVLEKPVLYFHRDGQEELRVDVRVQIPSGEIAEHWPLVAGASGAGLTWAGVRVVQGSCRGLHYPREGQGPCLGQPICEAATLGRVETQDSACLEYEGARYNHLFYRATVSGTPTLPLTISRERGAVTLHHGGAEALPGQVIYWDGGHASIAPAPSPGAQHTFSPPTADRAVALSAVADSLASAGLTEQEVSAFRAAWDGALFGGGVVPGSEQVSVDAVAVEASPLVLYLLSSADAAALATLRFDPPPRAVRRAIVVVMGLESLSDDGSAR